MIKYFLPILFLFNAPINISAQQSSRFTQSAGDFGMVNPAGLSFEEMKYRGTILNAHIRNQWLKFNTPGFPQTQTLTWLNNRSEQQLIGAAFVADKVGETREFSFQGRYAHAISKGLKIGMSAGLASNRVFIENLDVFDSGDEVAAMAGDARFKMIAGAGAFYNFVHPNRAWKWFAGASFRYMSFVKSLSGMEKPPTETDFFGQGGLGRKGLWIGSRFRISLNQPNAADFYFRKYFMDENLYFGGIVTTDQSYFTAGAQAGYEWKMNKNDVKRNQYLTLGLAFSKPLSKYIYGNNLIFDIQGTWSWEQKKIK